IIFIAIGIVIKISNKIIETVFNNRKINKIQVSDKRLTTLTDILKKVVKYILIFIGIVISLELFGINTTSIIATAGIGGIAIGFGAQSLVKDIISGFFILMEDQYAVGDHIRVNSKEGIVEELGVRITKIRAFSGDLYIIPNGSITMVDNMTRGAMRALVRISIAYEEDVDRAIEVMDRVGKMVASENSNIIDGPTVLGITEFGASEVIINMVAKTKPMEQWAVERELRKRIKQEFNKEGIEIPYSKLVLYKGDEQ
ncbi:MAG: mechanosensitive ion channel family protein, partial [Clostridia bacterium]|nr:mechanosensitive ion channel family protein [Clostridia bacterium]